MRNCLRWLFVACCTNSFLLTIVAQGADRPVSAQATAKIAAKPEPVEIREFEVRVDGKRVGTHFLAIKADGPKQEVEFRTDVKLDFVVYAYVFKFRGSEIWNDGRLEYSDIRAEDGGKKRAFNLKTNGEIQQVSFNGKSLSGSSSCVMSTAYWRLPSAELRTKPLTIVNVDTGTVHDAKVSVVGPATVSFDGRSLTCQHCKIDGPSPADLWFDDRNHLVWQKSVEQGHPTELRLKQIRMEKDEK